MSHIQNDSNTDGERPSSLQHGYRISLNLTRRIVRRMIELDDNLMNRHISPAYQIRVSTVPDAVSFQFSLRMLRRVVRRLIEADAQPYGMHLA